MKKKFNIFVALFWVMVVIFALIPFFFIVSMSFSDQDAVARYGFSIIPRKFTVAGYSYLFKNFGSFLRTALFTLFLAATAPLVSCVVNSMCAYSLSVSDFKLKGVINKYFIFSMFISGGMLPGYIIATQVYHLGNNPLIYYTGAANIWAIFLYRTFFKEVPPALIEAAKIDGAGDFQILWKIMLPMAMPIFGIQYTSGFIGMWNNADTSLIYISNPKFYTIQYYLKQILSNLDFLKQSLASTGVSVDFPTQTIQYAILVISLIPVFVLFPYMQKYYSKGMVSASVKG